MTSSVLDAKIKLIGSAFNQVNQAHKEFIVLHGKLTHSFILENMALVRLCLFPCSALFALMQFARPFTSVA